MGFNSSEVLGTLLGLVICSGVSALLAATAGRLVAHMSLRAAVLCLAVPAPAVLALWGSTRTMRGNSFYDWLAAWHLTDVVGLTIILAASAFTAWQLLRRRRSKVDPQAFG
jgi:hypothetical protein